MGIFSVRKLKKYIEVEKGKESFIVLFSKHRLLLILRYSSF